MDELGTADIEEFKLPSSGTIKLSQIKTEFNKGNNLKAYYGAASGVPSSGTIKVTDFYGKSKPPTGVAPYGLYEGKLGGPYDFSYPSGANTLWLWLYESEDHGGDFAPMLNEAGTSVLTAQGETDFDNLSRPHYVALFGRSESGKGELAYYNGYRYLTVQTSQGTTNFSGTWYAVTSPVTYFEFSDPAAGAKVAGELAKGSSGWFYLSLNN